MINLPKFKNPKGFTLVELLVVIGILAILLAIVLIAVNPARQFAQARNTSRRSDVLTVLNAVNQYFADNGALPTGISGTATQISDTGADLCSSLVPTYIAGLPRDPAPSVGGGSVTNCAGAYTTGYNVASTSASRVTVSAPNAEAEPPNTTPPTISVTR